MMSLYEFDGFDCQIWVNAMVQCIDVCSRCENEELPYDSEGSKKIFLLLCGGCWLESFVEAGNEEGGRRKKKLSE